MSKDLTDIRHKLWTFSTEMAVSTEGVVKNCSGCSERHTYAFGKYCLKYLANLAAGKGDILTEQAVEGAEGGELLVEDPQKVISELHIQIEKEKARCLEILQAEQVVALQNQLQSLKVSNKHASDILKQRIDSLGDPDPAGSLPTTNVQSTATVASGSQPVTSVTWSPMSTNMTAGHPLGQTGAGSLYGPTVLPGVVPFPSQMWLCIESLINLFTYK